MRLPLAWLAATALANVVVIASAQAAESTARGLSLSNYHIYSVRMDTTVKIPATGPHCTNVRVWQALPTYRPWSQANSPYGTLDQSATPNGAIVEPEKDNRSTHYFWSLLRGLTPNLETHFISSFRVVSPDRTFDVGSTRAGWNDIARSNAESRVTFPAARGEITALAEKLKYNHSPAETVVECSKWIKENMTYDAAVTWSSDDLQSIMTYRRGHCGHNLTVLKALCNAAGIQCRPVLGLNLHFPNGNSDYDQSRNDFTNGHIWGEVFLPDVGWIEVEPGNGEKCFNIPCTYIQNNTSFQNYAVWVTEQGGVPRVPKWVLVGRKYVNEYSVDNKITYSESRR